MLIITKNNNIVKKSVMTPLPKVIEHQPCCFINFLFKLCKLRRIIAVSGLLMCTIIVIQLVNNRSSLLSSSSDLDNAGDIVSGAKKTAKDLPGFFLKGKNPLNNTFCRFNYGLPHQLNWNEVTVTGTPELGLGSPYRVIYDVIERTMPDKSYTLAKVTYATHVTPEFLYHIVEIARFWDGPISVAAFVPDYDLEVTMKLFAHLCKCFDGMTKVSVHLVFPEMDPPIFLTGPQGKSTQYKAEQTATKKKEVDNKVDINDNPRINDKHLPLIDVEKISKNSRNVKDYLRDPASVINIVFKDCSSPDMSSMVSFRFRHGLIYPVNVARNVARNASKTQYNLVSDVELIPSDGLALRFTAMLKRHKINGHYEMIGKWRIAFVVPVFEVELGEDVPRNKSSLQQLYADGKAVYFHRWVCSHCQKIPDFQAWLKDDPGKVIKPFAVTKRHFPYHRWEPIYIATKYTPWYSETLSWEGRQDKMTQMLEMCLKSYDFVVVDGAFLCHSPGIKAKSKNKSWRHKHEQVNTKQYDAIIKRLAERYPANPKCRLG